MQPAGILLEARPAGVAPFSVVTATRAPRAPALAATAEAVAWLETYLAAGSRYSAQLRRDALADDISPYALHRAANELGVARIQAGRWSRWSLAEHAEAARDKRCEVCHEVRDREQFRRPPSEAYPVGRMVPTCNSCIESRSCRTDLGAESSSRPVRPPTAGSPERVFDPRRTTPAHAEAQLDRNARFAPSSAPAVELRLELARQRAARVAFEEAWPSAVHQAVDGLSHEDACSWRRAFSATRDAWRAAYDRTEAKSVDMAMATLMAA